MSWDIFWALYMGYLVVGVVISSCAKIGHKMRFGYNMHWLHWLAGVLIWPVILLFGRRE